MAERLGLRKPNEYKLVWILDFPLFEFNEEDQRWAARHHPFTSPKPEQVSMMDDPKQYGKIKANAYDMVLNGNEIGGGSIRIFQRELQEKMFAALGMSKEESLHKFGFLLGAFEYGAPHMEVSPLDSTVYVRFSVAVKLSVISSPFPKTTAAAIQCWMHPPASMISSYANYKSVSTVNAGTCL